MADQCVVCEDSLDSTNRATCSRCGNEFHLAMTVNSQAKDCGKVWVDEDYLGLRFMCESCYEVYVSQL